jgi:threonine dehydrogenase-like Zn-dependent dehydrogenase
METALNGVWDADVRAGDHVSVIGAGTVGTLVAWLASRIPGCAVELIDTNAGRSKVAEALGVAFAMPADARRGADVVVHASGSPSGLALALDVAGFEATVVEMSWYGAQSVPVQLGEAFHAQRLTLKSSQVGHVAPAQRARWDTRRRMALALSLLREATLDVLITGESDFEALPEVMPRLAAAPGDTLCHRIRYAQL